MASVEMTFQKRHDHLTALKSKNAGWTQLMYRVQQTQNDFGPLRLRNTIINRLHLLLDSAEKRGWLNEKAQKIAIFQSQLTQSSSTTST